MRRLTGFSLAGKRRVLGRAVHVRGGMPCFRRLNFFARGIQIGDEFRVVLQQGNGCRAHRAARVHVALPMRVADDPALSERQASRKQAVGAFGVDFGQDQRPGPPRRRMPRGV
ncbi:hypothetical protein D3C71_1382430 [compost metagenome]